MRSTILITILFLSELALRQMRRTQLTAADVIVSEFCEHVPTWLVHGCDVVKADLLAPLVGGPRRVGSSRLVCPAVSLGIHGRLNPFLEPTERRTFETIRHKRTFNYAWKNNRSDGLSM